VVKLARVAASNVAAVAAATAETPSEAESGDCIELKGRTVRGTARASKLRVD